MQWWPWGSEKRSSEDDGYAADYTDQELDRWEREVTGDSGNVEALAAVEAGVSMVENAFASVTVSPPIPALTPALLGLIGRAACLHGEHISLIDFRNGRLELLPSYATDVRGGSPVPADWIYWLTMPHPNGTQTTYARADAVAHFRWHCHPSQPWRGRSPLRLAKLSGETATAAERSMKDDLNIPQTRFFQAGATNEQAGLVSSWLRTGRGKIRTASGGVRSESQLHVFGPSAPPGVVTTRTAAAVEVAGALGIPVALLDPGAVGQAQRESYRRLVLLTVNPMLAVVRDELSTKLGIPDLEMSTSELAATDIIARAKTVKALVDAGLPLSDAVTAAGIMSGETAG